VAATRQIRVDEEVIAALDRRDGRTWNAKIREALGFYPRGYPFLVRVEPTDDRAYARTPEEAVYAARSLLEQARADGHRIPRASFYALGKLVRGSVTRTDLAEGLGVCWCGRGALRGYPRPGEAFCCAPHEALWGRMSPETRASVIVARFLRIYGGGPAR
jgi:hypothetical protein